MTVWQNGSAADSVNAIIAAKPVCATVEIAWQQLIYAVPRSAYTDVVFAFKINCTDVSANRNLVYRGVGTTSGAGVTAPFIKYSLSVNTLPEPHDRRWPVHTASTADSFFQTLTAGILRAFICSPVQA
jgi:hypothetical protein